MIELNDKQIAEYWHRSYTAVDGLWFLKTEQKYGFDEALGVDNEVWEVLPKIQARMLKSMANVQDGMTALLECLTTKLALDGFAFELERNGDSSSFRAVISRCPWHGLMVKSGRANLSGKVGTLICRTEYSAWASEFGDDIRFELHSQICTGSERCVLQFNRQSGGLCHG